MTTTFEDDVFVTVPCAGSEPVEFGACTGLCLGYDEVEFAVKAEKEVFVSFTISNIDTCTGFILFPRLHANSLQLRFTAGEFSENFATDTFSPLPYSICCEDLKSKVGEGWDGLVVVVATTEVNQTVSLQIHETSDKLPLSHFYPLVSFSVYCGDSVSCYSTGCPGFNIDSTTSDPFFNWGWTKLNSLLGPDVLSIFHQSPLTSTRSSERSISSILLISSIPDGEVLVDDTVGFTNFIYSTCQILYLNLVNDNGDNITTSPSPIHKQEETSWSDVLFGLNNGTTTTLDSSLALVNLGYLYTQTLQWKACKDDLESNLVISYEPVEIFTKSCLIPVNQSLERSLDPCCNNDPTLCCEGANYISQKTVYSYQPQKRTNSTCYFPDCVENTISSYAKYANNKRPCREMYESDVGEYFFNDPWEYCGSLVIPYHSHPCLGHATCVGMFGTGAYCFNSVCVIPCTDDAICYNGKCKNNFCEYDMEAPKSEILLQFSKCLLDKSDSKLSAVIIDDLVQKSKSDAPHHQLLYEELSTMTCNFDGPQFAAQAAGTYENEQECVAAAWCPTLSCMIGSTDWCTAENCIGYYDICTLRTPDNVLGDINIVDVEPHCTFRIDDTKADLSLYPEICAEFGGRIPLFYQYGGRIDEGICDTMIKTSNETDCYPSECIPNLISGVPCASYCYNDTVTTSEDCTTLGNGYTWFADNGICVFDVIYTVCKDNGLKYFLGKDFVPSIMEPGQCTSGFCAFRRTYTSYRQFPVHLAQDECEAYACSSCTMESTEPECHAYTLEAPDRTEEEYKELCFSTNTCATGSYTLPCLVTDDDWIEQVKSCPWTPEGCLWGFGGSCEYAGGEFVLFTEQDTCEGFSKICRETSILPTGALHTLSKYDVPEGFSRKNEEECNKCGYKYENFFKWEPSTWIRARYWVTGRYGKPTLRRPIWEPFPSQEKWRAVLERARAKRMSDIAISQLYCEFSVERAHIGEFSCNCRNEPDADYSTCQASLDSIYGSTITSTNACNGDTPYNVSTNLGATVLIHGNFRSSANQCSPVRLTSTDFRVLESPPTPISSLAVVSHTRRTIDNKRKHVYYFSHHSLFSVVGQVVGDGFGILLAQKNSTGVSACFTLPSRSEILERWEIPNEAPYFVGLASYDEETNSCVPTHVVAEIRAEAFEMCIDISGDHLFFPVALVKNYDTMSIVSTWTSAELGLFIFGSVMYFLLFTFSSLSLFSRIYAWTRDKDSILWNTAAIGLACLVVLALLRFVYFMTVPFGYYDHYFGLIVIFSDLPTLLYYFILVYLSFTWFDIYRQSKTLNPSPRHRTLTRTSVIIGSLCILWISFYIAFGLITNNNIDQRIQQITCTSPETGELVLSEKVSLTYKVIFAFYSVCLAVMFCVNFLLFASLGLSKKKASFILEFISIVTTAALLAQAVIAIVSIFEDMSNVLKVSLIIIFELFPLYGILLLFEDHHGLASLLSSLTSSSKTSNGSGKSSATRLSSKKSKSKSSGGL
eukprot:TRINITY_DN884_c0_g3_i4.p1 TRINITY_DN884_c0_g3~~TRINITY_DN884_c0_g3_i4.p1  ORF type:complete len:1499 (+),score=235.87 TRINITY_DN884_c0_g3_i4:883-5379(+)